MSQRILRVIASRAGSIVGPLLVIASSAACAQPWLPIQSPVAQSQREPAGYLISRTPHPSIARIVVPEKNGASFGTGSLVNVTGEYGLVITNWHVVRDASGPIYAFFGDGYQSEATVIKVDRDWDLAALSVKKPPKAIPVPIAQTAPRAGDWLCIAGYGSGDYRAAAGRCTQYVSPATNLPYEMVEVAAEARQGDSGGPILNERGELAGVLFGSGSGTTSGSYAGRVESFLQGVLPANPSTAQPPAAAFARPTPPPSLAPQQLLPSAPAQSNPMNAVPAIPASTSQGLPLAAQIGPPAADAHLFADNEAESSLLTADLRSSTAQEAYGLVPAKEVTPVEAPPRPLMPIPMRRDEPLTLVTGEAPVEDRTALRPTPSQPTIAGRPLELKETPAGPVPAEALNIIHTPLPSRLQTGGTMEAAPADQLLAAAWKQLGGSTLFDQGKTLLAALGLLGLLIQFWRMNNRSDHPDDE